MSCSNLLITSLSHRFFLFHFFYAFQCSPIIYIFLREASEWVGSSFAPHAAMIGLSTKHIFNGGRTLDLAIAPPCKHQRCKSSAAPLAIKLPHPADQMLMTTYLSPRSLVYCGDLAPLSVWPAAAQQVTQRSADPSAVNKLPCSLQDLGYTHVILSPSVYVLNFPCLWRADFAVIISVRFKCPHFP